MLQITKKNSENKHERNTEVFGTYISKAEKNFKDIKEVSKTEIIDEALGLIQGLAVFQKRGNVSPFLSRQLHQFLNAMHATRFNVLKA